VAAAGPAVPVASAAGFTDIPLTGMRRAIARRLTESKTTVPHFYVTANPNVDRLLALRREINETASRKISVNDFVIKAVAGALVEVPAANSIWGGDHIRRFDGVDIAIAVAVEGGLLTPIVRDAGNSTLSQISATVAELAERARAGRIRQEELEGGSFSISNLGMYGVDEFSAILNPPQSGILAVSAAKPRPVVGDDGELKVATVMTVTLSADHRVIDGAVAAEWMAAFVRRVENPLSILI
jgi:pyruvate dehydrogenase E2 component (dihydrolipoamide acetyltransferase)